MPKFASEFLGHTGLFGVHFRWWQGFDKRRLSRYRVKPPCLPAPQTPTLSSNTGRRRKPPKAHERPAVPQSRWRSCSACQRPTHSHATGYSFEFPVQYPDLAPPAHSDGRIDLYRRGCFVLEAKQFSLPCKPSRPS